MSKTAIVWEAWDNTSKAVVRKGPHSMTKKILSWIYCSRCGTIALKNDASRAVLRKPCETLEDAKG